MDDEIYYDMDILPEVRVLAAAYTPLSAGARNANFQRRAAELTGGGKKVGVYDIQPQMWTYERTADGSRVPYRAFVSIPGHLYENLIARTTGPSCSAGSPGQASARTLTSS